MRLDIKIPSQKNLQKAYDLFQSRKAQWQDFLKYFQWVRFDPRLGEILIVYMDSHWQKLNPLDVQEDLEKTEWPQVFAVLGEHVKLNLPKAASHKFKAWFDCATANVEASPFQLFFIGLHPLGGKTTQNEVFHSLTLYRRWGFFSAHLMRNKARSLKPSQTLMKKSLRLKRLQELLASKRSITVNEYIAFIGGAVSRRVAELDLKSVCKKRGQTKGSTYIKNAASF